MSAPSVESDFDSSQQSSSAQNAVVRMNHKHVTVIPTTQRLRETQTTTLSMKK